MRGWYLCVCVRAVGGALARLWAWCLCVVRWLCVAPSLLLYRCVLHTIHSPLVSLHSMLLFSGVSCCVYFIGCVTSLALFAAACMCE